MFTFRFFCRFFSALLLTVLLTVPLMVLTATLWSAAQAQSVPARALFGEPPVVDGGWRWLARVLDALSPGADTDVPLTPADIAARLSALIDAGRPGQALEIIEKYERLRSEQQAQGAALGTDVQLLFIKGRALSALGRTQDALALYQHMTVRFPELPEPWNNLAVEYLKQDQLERAHDALQMALTADPQDRTAQVNLARLDQLRSRQAHKPVQEGK